jgi:hypothetical protein
MIRHATALPGAIVFLAAAVPRLAVLGALMPLVGFAVAAVASLLRAALRAVSMAAVAASADRDQRATGGTDKPAVGLLNGRSPRQGFTGRPTQAILAAGNDLNGRPA